MEIEELGNLIISQTFQMLMVKYAHNPHLLRLKVGQNILYQTWKWHTINVRIFMSNLQWKCRRSHSKKYDKLRLKILWWHKQLCKNTIGHHVSLNRKFTGLPLSRQWYQWHPSESRLKSWSHILCYPNFSRFKPESGNSKTKTRLKLTKNLVS